MIYSKKKKYNKKYGGKTKKILNIDYKKKSIILKEWVEDRLKKGYIFKNRSILYDILLKCKKIYNLDNEYENILKKIFSNYDKILENILKQNNEFYMSQINIKCKKNGKRGNVYIPFEKWCELDHEPNGDDITRNIENTTFSQKKNYCDKWNEEKQKCDGIYWDYVNQQKILVYDLNQKEILYKLNDFIKKIKKVDNILVNLRLNIFDKKGLDIINNEISNFRKYLISITGFNIETINDLTKNYIFNKQNINMNNNLSKILSTLLDALTLELILFNLYFLHPSIFENELNSLINWTLLLLFSFIKILQ